MDTENLYELYRHWRLTATDTNFSDFVSEYIPISGVIELEKRWKCDPKFTPNNVMFVIKSELLEIDMIISTLIDNNSELNVDKELKLVWKKFHLGCNDLHEIFKSIEDIDITKFNQIRSLSIQLANQLTSKFVTYDLKDYLSEEYYALNDIRP